MTALLLIAFSFRHLAQMKTFIFVDDRSNSWQRSNSITSLLLLHLTFAPLLLTSFEDRPPLFRQSPKSIYSLNVVLLLGKSRNALILLNFQAFAPPPYYNPLMDSFSSFSSIPEKYLFAQCRNDLWQKSKTISPSYIADFCPPSFRER